MAQTVEEVKKAQQITFGKSILPRNGVSMKKCVSLLEVRQP